MTRILKFEPQFAVALPETYVLMKWGSVHVRGYIRFVNLSIAKGLRRKAAGFFTPFGRSHRHGVLRENDMTFLLLDTL